MPDPIDHLSPEDAENLRYLHACLTHAEDDLSDAEGRAWEAGIRVRRAADDLATFTAQVSA